MRNLLTVGMLVLVLAGCGGGGGGGGGGAPDSGGTESGATPSSYTVSGTIRAAGAAAVDGDLNDPSAPYRANDSAAQAQHLPNPVVLGGWASASGTGISGDRYADSGDLNDVYHAYLVKDQVVTLSISDHEQADPTAVDLDLYLYALSAPGVVVASSAGSGKVESFTVPASGDYYLAVQAASGWSNYVLSIGQSGLAAYSEPTLRLEDEFVPGEVVVRIHEHSQRLRSVATLAERLPPGLQLRRKGGDSALLSMGNLFERQQTLQALGLSTRPEVVPGLGAADSVQRLKHETLQVVKALRARGDIAAASPNYLRRTAWKPNDEHYDLQWHYPLIYLPQAWDVTRGSSSVIVAVVDTGVYMAHPDLAGNLLNSGYDFIADADAALDGDGIDADPDDPGDGGPTGVSSYHGSHVAGTVAAVTDNGTGTAGVAPLTKIMPLRVLGKDGAGTSYDVMQALRYAARLSNDSGTVPPAAADIINLSLGGPGYSQVEQDFFKTLYNRGIMVVAAAGNAGSNTVIYPAGYTGVVGVGAVDINKTKAGYSNTGSHVDVVAPGGDGASDYNGDGYPDAVLSTIAQGSGGSRSADYWFYQGTSMATPHVAGVMALMKALHSDMTPADFDAALAGGRLTEDLGGDGPTTRNNRFGYGLIDAFQAVSVANDLSGGGALEPVLLAEPDRLYFADGETSKALTLSNAGGGNLRVTGITDNADWLEVTAASVDADGEGDYTVTVDRSGLGNASYPATITVAWEDTGDGSTDQLQIPVTMQVGSYAVGDTGHLYILLINADTGATAYQLAADASAGSYSFSFSEVAAGDYYLIAGSDADNDLHICDAGEACGAWPVVDQPKVLSIEDHRTGLEFDSTFNAGLGNTADQERPSYRRR